MKNSTMSIIPCPRTEAITAMIANKVITNATPKAIPDNGSVGVGIHIAIIQKAHTTEPETMPVIFPINCSTFIIASVQYSNW